MQYMMMLYETPADLPAIPTTGTERPTGPAGTLISTLISTRSHRRCRRQHHLNQEGEKLLPYRPASKSA